VKVVCKTICRTESAIIRKFEESRKCYDDFKRGVFSLASRQKITVLHGRGRRGVLCTLKMKNLGSLESGLNVLVLEKEWLKLTQPANPFRRIAAVEWSGDTLKLMPPLTFGKSKLPVRSLKLTEDELSELRNAVETDPLTPPTHELEDCCSTVMGLDSVNSVRVYVLNLWNLCDLPGRDTRRCENVLEFIEWSLGNLDMIATGRDIEQYVHRIGDGCVVLKNNVVQRWYGITKSTNRAPLEDFMRLLPTPLAKNYVLHWLARLAIGATVYIHSGASMAGGRRD